MQKAKEAETLTMARMKHRAEVQDAGLLETLRNAYQLAADAGETEEAARLARAIRDTLLTHVDAHGSIYRLEMAAPDSKSFLDWLDWLKTLASVIASSEWARYRRSPAGGISLCHQLAGGADGRKNGGGGMSALHLLWMLPLTFLLGYFFGCAMRGQRDE